MTVLPNPFDTGVFTPVAPVEAAASTMSTGTDDAAADIPLDELIARGFDPDGFVSDCEPLPAFLAAPSQSYLRAGEIFRVLRVIAGH